MGLCWFGAGVWIGDIFSMRQLFRHVLRKTTEKTMTLEELYEKSFFYIVEMQTMSSWMQHFDIPSCPQHGSLPRLDFPQSLFNVILDNLDVI